MALLNPLESASQLRRQMSETNAKALFVFPVSLLKEKVVEIVKESQVRDVILFGKEGEEEEMSLYLVGGDKEVTTV